MFVVIAKTAGTCPQSFKLHLDFLKNMWYTAFESLGIIPPSLKYMEACYGTNN